MVFKKVISWFGKDSADKKEQTPAASRPVKNEKRRGPAQRHAGKPRPKKPQAPFVENNATLIPRESHPISRNDVSPSALKVLYRLKDNGYEAYLVGGCIRDILLGLQPKDFDVVTNATPEQVKACFSNCRLIGRRFRLAHIMFGRELIEVATMRGHHDTPVEESDSKDNQTSQENGHADKAKKTSRQSDEGQLLRDNVYGSIDEDAERRDFTINALYYDIRNFSILDFANGMADIEKGVVDLIGDPETRYREDPVRMLRAIRFSTKLRMQIAPRTKQPIYELNHLLINIPPARLFDEALKLFLAGKAVDNVAALREFGIFRYFFPIAEQVLTGNPLDKEERLLATMLTNTDARINAEKSISPAFVLAALFWYPLEAHASELELESGLSPYDAFQVAMSDILQRAVQTVAIPKRFTATMRDIWSSQHRLLKTEGKRPMQMVENPRFRAAYDFLLLRAEAEGGELHDIAQFWTDYQQTDEAKRAIAKSVRTRANASNATPGPRGDRKPNFDSKDGDKPKSKRGKYRGSRRRKKEQ